MHAKPTAMKRFCPALALVALLAGAGALFFMRGNSGESASKAQVPAAGAQEPSGAASAPQASGPTRLGATPTPMSARQGQGAPPDVLAAALAPSQVEVSGQVVNTQSKKPEAGVDVVLSNALGESTATSDDDGNYALRVLPGRYKMQAIGESVASAEVAIPVLTDMQRDVWVFSFATIEGVVRLPGGEPASGVAVLAVGQDKGGASERGQTETEDDGNFVLQASPGTSRLVAITPSHGGQAKVVALGVGKSLSGVVIDMLANGTVSGTVVDAQGEPVANARVLISVEFIGQGRYDRRPHLSDAQGAFAWLLPQFGHVIVEADAAGYAASVPQTFTLEPGQSQEGLRLVLGEAEFSLRGQVVDAQGRALAGVEVSQGVQDSKSRYRNTRSDEKGRFAFEKLGKGPHRLRARLEGYKLTRLRDLEAPNETVEIVMEAE
tara:strand:- start:10534 stop:11841 length:1308 start_codon:yes stop_codon:yes gene_type:complete